MIRALGRWGLPVFLAGAALAPARPHAGPPPFDAVFRDTTMRVDYFHTGDGDRQSFALDRVVSDGRWAGSRTVRGDSLDLGTWRFTVTDSATGEPLYSRGYSSLFAEWATTAPSASATFHESLRFPWPRRPVRIRLDRRDAGNGWVPAWSFFLDPDGPAANAAEPAPAGRVWTVFENGPPATRVDLVLVGDGYTREELPRFHRDVRRLVTILFATEPFRSHRGDFNVRAVDIVSPVSGVNRPLTGRFRRTPLSLSYGALGLARYMLTEDNRALRDALSGVPYEFVEVLANDDQYGGGGIFNFQATTAAHTAEAPYIFVHEFGHHFAGLADEYYTSPVTYQTGAAEKVEPWELNVTALHDPAGLKWRDLLTPGTPVPTPWPKAEYEAYQREYQARRQAGSGTVPDSLARWRRERERALLDAPEIRGTVGAFEGASYEATGLYRSEIDCIMFTRRQDFCRVCRRAIEATIGTYTR